MDMRVYEDNGRSEGMEKVRTHKVWKFSSNEFWDTIGCLISAPTFDIEGSRL